MKKKLSTNGNSWTLYINKVFASIMGINQQCYSVDIYIDKNVMHVLNSNVKNGRTDIYTKKLIKRGSGYALVLSKPLLSLMEINPETDILDIELNDGILKIKKSA